MGRMRIKKKESVIPLRETLAYRMMLVLVLILLFVAAIYELVTAIQAQSTPAIVVSMAAGAGAAIGVFYNLGKARFARIPDRSKRR